MSLEFQKYPHIYISQLKGDIFEFAYFPVAKISFLWKWDFSKL